MEITYLADHVRYTTWATRRMLDAIAGLSEEEFTRDTKAAFGSVRGTLVHMFGTARWWYSVLTGEQIDALDWVEQQGDGATFGEIQDAYLSLLGRYEALASRLTHFGDAWAFGVTPVTIQGSEIRKWQGLLDIVSHDTHHRGQLSALLRQLDHEPPELDLILYYTSH